MKKSVIKMPKWPSWNIKAMSGYEPISTFWDDYWVAILVDGESGVRDTYRRTTREWKGDYRMITEMVLVLNHIGWALYERWERMARVFFELWEELNEWCWENLEGEEKEYFYRVTD